MNWFEIVLIDGNRGLINLNNVIDVWKDLNAAMQQSYR